MSNFKNIDENLRNKSFGYKLDLGVYGKENNSNSFFIDITAIVLSIAWVVFSIFFLTFREKCVKIWIRSQKVAQMTHRCHSNDAPMSST